MVCSVTACPIFQYSDLRESFAELLNLQLHWAQKVLTYTKPVLKLTIILFYLRIDQRDKWMLVNKLVYNWPLHVQKVVLNKDRNMKVFLQKKMLLPFGNILPHLIGVDLKKHFQKENI